MTAIKREKVHLLLMGGLGNQLFQYATALYGVNKYAAQLVLDLRFLKFFGIQHPVSLNEFDFKEPTQVKPYSEKFEFLKKLFVKCLGLLRRNSFFINFLAKYLRIHLSSQIDEKITLRNIKPPRLILGYFQNKSHIDLVKNSIILPALPKIASDAFYEYYNFITINKIIALHVRLGDYKSEKNTFGNLSENYYLNAQDLYESQFPNSKYMIFTNDTDAFSNDFSTLLSRDCNTLFNNQETLSDFDIFCLMSACSGHIIANSTFSYWAAALSTNSRMVIRPSKWFKNLVEPEDLFPDKWRASNSEWT
jgi:hypothetical protein